jgi:hypothetical protein
MAMAPLTLDGSEITEFRDFASSILTPAQYADESQLFLNHEQPPNPPFMVLFDNLRRICREQHSIIQRGMDQATLVRGVQSFSHLREFKVHFCSALEREDCFEYFIGMDMTMVSRSYIHHFRTISVALSCTKLSRLDVLHLSDLRIPKGHLTAADTGDLSRYLGESLWRIKTLKLTRSEWAMQVLQYCNLKITQLDICGMTIDYTALQGFIAHGPLRSVGFHDILISNAPPPLGGILPFFNLSILRQMAGAIRTIHNQEGFCHCHSTGHRVLLGDIDN